MDDYIRREAAKAQIRKAYTRIEDRVAINCVINDVPAADVVEVRHGRWDRVDYGNGLYNYHCSSCRHIPRENTRSNYCPNCGAKMEV